MTQQDEEFLRQALDLARRGEGFVEPNPMVGCVLTRDGQLIGQGWHQQFGGPHAEVEALRSVAGRATGATAYVSLEPCCHHGQTPPCVAALIAAGVSRVAVGCVDPNPQVAGGGLAALRAAGVEVDLAQGPLARHATDLIAPFAKLVTRRRPWVLAKWAMTLDGKLAARDGSSKWITGSEARQVVHALRGRVDGVMVGRATAQQDDPRLTARPPGPRTPTRIVVDSRAALSLTSRLVRSVTEAPLLVAVGRGAADAKCADLRQAGVEIWQATSAAVDLAELLDELGRRRMTNLLVEGGGVLLGSLRDLGEIDEVHAFVAPRLIGGPGPSPLAGMGEATIAAAWSLQSPQWRILGEDAYLHGRVAPRATTHS